MTAFQVIAERLSEAQGVVVALDRTLISHNEVNTLLGALDELSLTLEELYHTDTEQEE